MQQCSPLLFYYWKCHSNQFIVFLLYLNIYCTQTQRGGFLWQSEKNKLQLLEVMGNRTAGKRQGWRTSFTTNVCVALLGGLKVNSVNSCKMPFFHINNFQTQAKLPVWLTALHIDHCRHQYLCELKGWMVRRWDSFKRFFWYEVASLVV